jgi:hypothetical protein
VLLLPLWFLAPVLLISNLENLVVVQFRFVEYYPAWTCTTHAWPGYILAHVVTKMTLSCPNTNDVMYTSFKWVIMLTYVVTKMTLLCS